MVIFDNFLEFFHQNRGYVALSGVHIPVTYLPELLRETVHKIYEFIILMFKIIDLTVRTQNVLRHGDIIPVLLHGFAEKLVQIHELVSHMEPVKIYGCYVSITEHHAVIIIRAVTIAKPFVVVCEIILKQRQALLCLAVKIIKCLYVHHLKVILQGSPADKISYPAKLIYLSIQISRSFFVYDVFSSMYSSLPAL